MATSTVASITFLNQLKSQRDEAFSGAERLEHRARMLDELISEYESGKQQGQRAAQVKLGTKTATAGVPRKPMHTVQTKAKTQPAAKKSPKLVSKAKAVGKHKVAGADQSTMEIVRQVLNNEGREMRVEEIRRRSKEDFGHAPAQSLDQMLYKRSKAGSTFYAVKDEDNRNRYGLLVWREQGRTPQQAA